MHLFSVISRCKPVLFFECVFKIVAVRKPAAQRDFGYGVLCRKQLVRRVLKSYENYIFVNADADRLFEFTAQIVRAVTHGFGNVGGGQRLEVAAADILRRLYNLAVGGVDIGRNVQKIAVAYEE